VSNIQLHKLFGLLVELNTYYFCLCRISLLYQEHLVHGEIICGARVAVLAMNVDIESRSIQFHVSQKKQHICAFPCIIKVV